MEFIESLHKIEKEIAVQEFGASIHPTVGLPYLAYMGMDLFFRGLIPEAKTTKLVGLVAGADQVVEPWYLEPGTIGTCEVSALRPLLRLKMASALDRAKEQVVASQALN